MKAIVLPRAAGKTARMLSWLVADRDHVLVVFSARERDRLRQLLEKENAPEDKAMRVVALSELLAGAHRGRWKAPIYGVDELDQVLRQLLGGPVALVTFTGELAASTSPTGFEFKRVNL